MLINTTPLPIRSIRFEQDLLTRSGNSIPGYTYPFKGLQDILINKYDNDIIDVEDFLRFLNIKNIRFKLSKLTPDDEFQNSISDTMYILEDATDGQVKAGMYSLLSYYKKYKGKKNLYSNIETYNGYFDEESGDYYFPAHHQEDVSIFDLDEIDKDELIQNRLQIEYNSLIRYLFLQSVSYQIHLISFAIAEAICEKNGLTSKADFGSCNLYYMDNVNIGRKIIHEKDNKDTRPNTYRYWRDLIMLKSYSNPIVKAIYVLLDRAKSLGIDFASLNPLSFTIKSCLEFRDISLDNQFINEILQSDEDNVINKVEDMIDTVKDYKDDLIYKPMRHTDVKECLKEFVNVDKLKFDSDVVLNEDNEPLTIKYDEDVLLVYSDGLIVSLNYLWLYYSSIIELLECKRNGYKLQKRYINITWTGNN